MTRLDDQKLSRKRRWILGLFGCAGLIACGINNPEGGHSSPLNVLLVVVDTLRADHLGVYGYEVETSPRIDEFAREALVFESMYSQAPWTKPSIASMFTSLYPPQHLVLKEGTDNQLSNSLTTLAEVLADAGYRTGAVSQNPHVQAKTGFDQGFGEFHGIPGYQSGVDEMVSIGSDFLDKGGDAPFFLYMHFLDPHGPYDPPAEFRKEYVGNLSTQKKRIFTGRVGKMLADEEMIQEFSGSDLPFLEALYDGEIRWVDSAVGKMLDALQARGLRERTLVIFTADHGEEFLDHGTVKHGYQVYEESINIPLIVRLPDGAVGRNSQRIAQHVDLMPTILDLTGLEAPPEVQGSSLRKTLEGVESDADLAAFIGTSWRDIERYAVREGVWKLVGHVDQDRMELYNLSVDPAEKLNVIADHADIADRLLAAYLENTASIQGVTPEDATGASDPELEKALRAIGYIGGDDEDQ
ncbi:MAG: arylsulfatase A-like enzyme [Planctomycetota bacterium]|jgi:arylsulfatase A-like enzyme